MIGRHSIFEAVGPPRIFSKIPAESRDLFTGRVGLIDISITSQRIFQSKSKNPWLYHCPLILDIDLQDLIHSGKVDDDATLCWNGASAQVCPRPSPQNMNPCSMGKFDDFGHFLS